MAKIVAVYGPPTDPEAFEAYYQQTHIPLAMKIPGVERVELTRIVGTAQGDAPSVYRIAELWFADMAQLQAGAGSAEGQAAVEDLAAFATGGVTLFIAEVDPV